MVIGDDEVDVARSPRRLLQPMADVDCKWCVLLQVGELDLEVGFGPVEGEVGGGGALATD
jgi:hypothetical protein